MRMQTLCIVLCVAVIVPGCKESQTKNTTNTVPERKAISPRVIDLAGISFAQTPATLKEKLPTLRCDRKDRYIEMCQWKTTERDRNDSYPGVEQIKFTFFQDTLQMFEVTYSQMIDLEYAKFEKAIREKYAYVNNGVIDTVLTQWVYDSLTVTLTPKRQKHWAGDISTYTPVLEFKNEAVYRRWREVVGSQEVKTIY